MDELEKLQGTSSTLHQTLCINSNSSVNSNWSYCRETLNLGQNRRFFVPCDLEFWWITLKSSRAPLLCCFKLCASFYSHRWIKKTCSPETLNSGQNRRSIALCDLEIWQWHWKTIWHLFYVASSFVHHFIAIGGFKLKLQSGNAQSGSKSAFCPVWPWHLTDDYEKQ